MMWMGLPQLLFMPFIPALMKRIDPRVMCGFGFAILGVGLLMNSNLTFNFGQVQFAWCQAIRAMAIPFIITPSTALAYDGIEPENIGNASGLFNMVRNLGGSVGIGLFGAIASRRYTFQFSRLTEAFSSTDAPSVRRFAEVTRSFQAGGSDLITANQQAVQSIGGLINRQSWILSYADCFYVLAIITFLCIGSYALMKKSTHAATTVAAH